jgi:hypothetical protein
MNRSPTAPALLVYGTLTFLAGAAAPLTAQQDSLRIFFMGRSEYGSSGAITAPFEEICTLAGMICSAHRHWDFVERDPNNGLPIGMAAMARNRHVRDILASERFHVIFFSFGEYLTEFYSPEPAFTDSMLAGAASLYLQVTAAGARPFIYVVYATQDNPGDSTRIDSGARMVQAHLNGIAAEAGTKPAVMVPVRPYFAELAEAFGTDRWFADPLHPSEFGQYAIARLLFVFVTGRDPASFAHPARIADTDAQRIDAAINRVRAQRRDAGPWPNRAPAPTIRTAGRFRPGRQPADVAPLQPRAGQLARARGRDVYGTEGCDHGRAQRARPARNSAVAPPHERVCSEARSEPAVERDTRWEAAIRSPGRHLQQGSVRRGRRTIQGDGVQLDGACRFHTRR